MSWVAAAVASATATYQVAKGIKQKKQAKKLKESTFVPQELLMNKSLAEQQAYSRRAPGQAFAEEQVRRNAANQIAGAQRSFGGDANKVAAVTSAATAGAQDANSRLAAQGQQFSEGGFGRLANANTSVAGQKRQNRDEFNQTKAALLGASDQNIYNGISNAAAAASSAVGSGGGVDSSTRQAADAKISMGRTLNSQTPNRGGDPYIKEGRQMIRDARRNSRMSNPYMMNPYNYNQFGGNGGYGYGNGGGYGYGYGNGPYGPTPRY